MDNIDYHKLSETIPLGKNPRENEVRHPELPCLVPRKDEKQQRQSDYQVQQ